MLDKKLDSDFLVFLIKHRLNNLEIKTEDDLIAYLDKSCIHEKNKETVVDSTFNDDILSILEIVTIFCKFKDMMGESKIGYAYENEKKKE